MGVAVTLHIHQFSADITDGTALVSHVAHTDIAHHRQLTVGILHDVAVAVENSRHTGHIGQGGGELF